MFELLPSERYNEIIHLFDRSRFINAARSHLERTPRSKKVFVDSLTNPQTAAMIVKHRTFIGGNSKNLAFNKALRNYLFEEKREELETLEIFELDFYFASEDWIEALEIAFPYSFPYPRFYYEITELSLKEWRNNIPEGFIIKPVNISLLKNSQLKNYDWIIEEIEENWLPFEENLQEICGYYLVYKNEEIVSWCVTEYLTKDNHIEVGIATREEYRKQGLATIVGSATAEYCLSKYNSVGWHCNTNNTRSCKTAEKIGFKVAKEYQKVACFFNKIDNFIVHGYYKFLHKNFEEAIKFYSYVIEAKRNKDKDIETSVYLTKWGFSFDKLLIENATFYAVQGKEEEALNMIKEAINNGYKDIESFDSEEYLTILHSRAEWRDLRAAILKNKGEKNDDRT
ncbi:MAG: GNAT family N-acetyltransferase [Candidatus Heimdallarchaeaceae archaeon]